MATESGGPGRAAELRGRTIVFVLGSLDIGGSERQALGLARYLKTARGADVRVLGLQGGRGGAAAVCDEGGIPWRGGLIRWPDGRAGRLREVVRFAAALRRERPDVVLPYTRLPNILCGLAWKRARAATCVWNQRDEGLGLSGGRLERMAIRRTPFFISNGEAGKAFLVAERGVSPERIAVVPNGVLLAPPRDDRARWRERLGLGDGRFAAVMLASVHPHKDHETLLRGWRRVVGALGGTEPPLLLLAGRSYGFEERLKALAFDLGVAGAVRFIGPVDDVAGLLRAADLYVHSARTEGLPNAVLEAMASGLAVVGSDIPGIRDAVGPAGLRFLAPPADHEAFADRVLELAASPGLRAEVGAALAARARERFDPEAMCGAMAGIVSRALEAGR